MPIFEYLCDDCGSKFEKLVRRAASDSASEGVPCPSCGQEHARQQFSTFAARANGGAAKEMGGSCPSGMCRTPDVCGRN
ncbi:MAG TPA: zinc ribbon domain-containing protein [Bryobacteraceae bacterium]